MARPPKKGLDYFPLDVDLDEKVELLEAKYGIQGFGVLIKIWQRIYKNGYYIEWSEDMLFLFKKQVNVDVGLISALIDDCLRIGIFEKSLYLNYGILTSKAIQKRYIIACERRSKIEMFKEFCLLENINVYINLINVPINGGLCIHDVDINATNKSKVNKSILNNNIHSSNDDSKAIESSHKNTQCTVQNTMHDKNTMHNDDIDTVFESLWSYYPLKRGKASVNKKAKKNAFDIGEDHFRRAIDRYKDSVKFEREHGFKELKYQNGSTFFNSGYLDYLDENYEPPQQDSISSNPFLNDLNNYQENAEWLDGGDENDR